MSKHRIGEFVEPVSVECGIQECPTVAGISIDKEFIPSRNVGEDTSGYLFVPPDCFSFNPMHVGRDEKIPVALNNTEHNIVVSPAYSVFRVTGGTTILKEYLYMLMSSPEFDRFAWFCTDSSIRGNLEWPRFCDIELELPPIGIQQKYVDIYMGMQTNIAAYENSCDDLRLTCDAYIEKLIVEAPKQAIGPHIELSDERNEALQYGVDDVRGISIEKRFIKTKAKMDGVSVKPYLIVKPGYFSYVTVTSRNGDKASIAQNDSSDTYVVSSSYLVFHVKDKEVLPSYLLMYFVRPEFDRYARFNSWGSAREVFGWDDLCRFEIPIPSLAIQQDIVDIFDAHGTRRQISERLSELQRSMCPILIKGALDEAKREVG